MDNIVYFDSIGVREPRDRIYRRLGYREGMSHLGDSMRGEIERGIDYAVDLIRLRGVARRCSIIEHDHEGVSLEGAGRIQSVSLARFLAVPKEVFLIAATGGDSIVDAIAAESAADNLSRAVVLDAAASEIVDAALDWLCDCLGRQLRRENRCLTKHRYSAGYGDFDLAYQKTIYDILHLDRIGISINEQCLLIPEKSVTAVVGIVTIGEGTGL